MNIRRTFTAVLLVTLLLLQALMPATLLPIPAAKAEKTELTQLQQKKQQTQSRISRIRKIKLQLQHKSAHVTNNIVKNQQRLDTAVATLQTREVQLKGAQYTLEGLESSLKQAEVTYKDRKAKISHRIRRFYMEERVGLLQLILDAKSLSALLDRVYYKQRIYEQDRKLIKAYLDSIAILNQRKDSLLRQKNRLHYLIKSIQVNKNVLQRAIAYDKKFKSKLDRDIQAYDDAQRELEQESRSIESDILSLIRRSGSGQGAKQVKSTGIFSWPASGPLRSRFGYRSHPIFGGKRMHTGLDIGAPNGSPVKAADGGTVLFAGWRGGYGKTVIVNHGNRNGSNLTTLYGHLSSISVSAGQAVDKGKQVGRVGSTGYSTGPHLHFEVRVNGSPVDPLRYLR